MAEPQDRALTLVALAGPTASGKTAAALELAETMITVNSICPGFVDTPLVRGQIADQAKANGISEERVVKEIILASQPTKRFVTADQIAEMVLFLCSDAASGITGSSFSVDGGWTAR